MTIEHAADGTKTYTSPEGVITKHADMSAALHFQRTGQRVGYDTPEGSTAAPAGGPAPTVAPVASGAPNAIDAYKDRCRNIGRARAEKSLLGGR